MHRLNVSITLPELTVSAVAFTGDFPVLFYLNIKTYKFMNAHHSKWYQTEMGTITMEILKSPSPYVWRNIHAELHHNPHNQYIWWEIYRLYQDQFEAGFSLLADTEMKRDEKEDQYHLREERMISDKRLIREKLAEQKAIQNQITRDKMYCTEMRNKKRNYIADPFEWEAWQV